MSVTIKKIAADLKLAVSTVSKALVDSHEISVETKQRVLEYARKLDYVPNTYASNLKKKKTGNIAVVVPEVADSYFSTAINGIESVAQEKGYHVIIYITHEDQSKEQSILREFKSGRVDGILMSVSDGKNTSHLNDLLGANVPLVFFDRACDAIDVAKVITDDLDSSYKATSLLLARGCKQIAFLGLSENLSIIQKRLEGYREAMADHGFEVNRENIVNFGSQETQNYALLKKILTSANRPDGIIGSTEKLATLCYSVCHELKLSIPKDVKVIGFSSMNIASLLNPSLTTVTQPAFEMGKAAAAKLFHALEHKKSTVELETIVIPSAIYERESTRS